MYYTDFIEFNVCFTFEKHFMTASVKVIQIVYRVSIRDTIIANLLKDHYSRFLAI